MLPFRLVNLKHTETNPPVPMWVSIQFLKHSGSLIGLKIIRGPVLHQDRLAILLHYFGLNYGIDGLC